MNKLLTTFGILVGALAALLFWGGREYQDTQIRPKQKEIIARLESNITPFLDAQKGFSDLQSALATPQKSNAATFLRPMVRWSDTEDATGKPIELPEGIVKQLSSWKYDFMGHATEMDYSAFDFTWLAQLSSYDHLDWDAVTSTEALTPFNLISRWIPQLKPMAWAKLRLLKGASENKILEALQEVRHLAVLLYSTENLTDALAAVSVLRIESAAFKVAVATTPELAGQWKTFEDEMLLDARKRIVVTQAFLHPYAPKPLLDRFFSSGPILGLCQGFSEVGTLIFGVIFFEQEYKPFYQEIIGRANGCRLTSVKAALAAPPTDYSGEFAEAAKQSGMPIELLRFISKFPFYRHLLAETMLLIVSIDAFESAEKMK